MDPISVVFSTPEDNLPRISARLDAGAKLPVTVFDRANVKRSRPGRLTTFDNQIDTTTGTFKLRVDLRQPRHGAVPEPVRQRAPARRHDEGRGACAEPGGPARAERQFRLCRQGRHTTVSVRNVIDRARRFGQHTVDRLGPCGGDKVVIDGVDRLRDGAKVKWSERAAAGSGQAGAGAAPGPAARSAKGAGQHHHRRHDQSGAAQDSAARSGQCAPGPRCCSGVAQGEALRPSRPRQPDQPGAAIRCASGAATPQPTAGGGRPRPGAMTLRPGRSVEPVAHLHRSAGRDLASDDRDPAHRRGRLSLPAALGVARGRLSDDPGADLLSRRQPGGDDLVGHRAARAAVRPDGRALRR